MAVSTRGLTFDEIARAKPAELGQSTRMVAADVDLARDGFRAGQEMARQVLAKRAAASKSTR